MHTLKVKPNSPKNFDKTLEALVAYLNLRTEDAVRFKFSRPLTFNPEVGNCHFNVLCQIRTVGGQAQPGWVLAQDKQQSFAEAIFHTAWRAPDGKIIDLTPRKDMEKRLLFVPDPQRTIVLTKHEGKPAIHTFDNVRILRGSLMTPLTEITVVMEDDFAQRQGLWPW